MRKYVDVRNVRYNPHVNQLFLLGCLFAAPAFSQTAPYGSFTNSDDVGHPSIQGSADFDGATGQYKITGSGSDIWGKADQFHYVWREMSGNFAVTATARFLTDGIGHRKAVIMLRKSLDTDSPFVQLAIHGDGTPAVQFRNTKADNVNTVDFPIEGPGTWKLKLVRDGANVAVWIAKDDAPLKELGTTMSQLGSPVLVGLGVSSHSDKAINTVLFSNVSVDQLPASDAAHPALGIFTNSGDIGSPAVKGAVEFSNGEYRVTGSGANIWGKHDQFHYVWREISGNFTASATMRILGEGVEHRKGGLMIRQSLEPDSAFADVMIHGSGMAALQWRGKPAENVNTFDLPAEGPGTYKIKLVRNGVKVYMYLGKGDTEPVKIANTEVTFQNPVLLGLAVCAHQSDGTATVLFSDVSVDEQPTPASKTR